MGRTAPTVTAACLTLFTAVASLAADRAPAPQPKNLTAEFVNGGFNLDRLEVYEIGGVVLIRGRAHSKLEAESVGRFAQSLGYQRVANLIQVIALPDDVTIERTAEYELTNRRTLDGCRFTVDSDQGVLSIAGTVRHELQKDMALRLLRNIDGVREVRSDALVRQ